MHQGKNIKDCREIFEGKSVLWYEEWKKWRIYNDITWGDFKMYTEKQN